MRPRPPRKHFPVVAALLLAMSCRAAAAEVPSTRELSDLSLEELANLEITSVSKRAERLADSPASVFVITADDIRRSGVTSLPEALRLAPNLQVAQVSSSAYNIRARGINNNSANKLLVLIDGRSVYSPLFSGVFWDVQDVMLQDIERIEVVSGPGGTLWGVNAVNGVINVITRSADETQGGLLVAGGGNRRDEVAMRYGGELGGDGHYRVYGRYFDREHTSTAAGARIADGWYKTEAGFRADWDRGGDQLMVAGNAYRGTVGQPLPGSISIGVNLALAPIPVQGVNLTGRWSHQLQNGSEVMVQAYYDRTERTVPPTFAEELDIFDVQLQHSLRWADKYSLVWGGEYRYSVDRLVNSAFFAFLPADLNQKWGSLFAQGEAKLRDDLRLTVGARLERNDYTGAEFLPNVRLGWKVRPDHLLWTAASRTVRAPSRLDRDAFVPGTPPFLLDGGRDVRSEIANVYEIGWRGKSSGMISYSATLFHARYDRLHTQEVAPSGTFLVFAGLMEGTTTGVEMWGAWQVAKNWRISAGYTAQREDFRLKPGSNDAGAVGLAGRDPAHTWLVRSTTNLSERVDLDVTVRGVAALANPEVPRYSTADINVGWRPRPDLELSVGARNLGGGHGEFTNVGTRAEIDRSIYVSVRWDFDRR